MKMVSTSFTIATVISLMMCCTVPAGPPRQVSAIAKNSKSLNVTWSAPATPNGVITEYQLQCSGGGQVFNHTVMETMTTLSGLLPYTNYSCSITAHTSVGGGPAATISVTTLQDSELKFNASNTIILLSITNSVPSGPPQSFRLVAMSHNITLSWSPPLPSQRNGVIISYLITCSSGGSIINSTRTSSTSLTITGLEPFTNYTCSVRATTVVGDGPAAVNTVETQKECRFLC